MKASLLLSSLTALAIFLPMNSRAAEAVDQGYVIEVKVTPKEREAQITTVTGVDIHKNSVELPLTLSHSETPATISLSFEDQRNAVSVRIQDAVVLSGGEGSPFIRRDYFDATLFFEYGKENQVCATATETVSFTVTALAEDGTKAESGKGPEAGDSGSIDISKLEVDIQWQRDRGEIYVRIYNPTQQTIRSLVLRVTAPPAGDFKGLDRRYRSGRANGIEPMTDSSLTVHATLPELPEGVEYEFTLESVN